jgi:hypothetical protein
MLIFPSSLSARMVPGSARHSPRTPITMPTVVPVFPDTPPSIPARPEQQHSQKDNNRTPG